MVAIGAIIKNEYPYITEWVAYHKALGFDKIYIVDNISNDGSSELLSKLHLEGEITRIEYKTIDGIKPQVPAYNLILERAKNECEYIAFIDADEFFYFEDNDGCIHDLVKLINSQENIGAVAINWCVYGSSYAILPGEGLIIERFDHRATQNNLLNSHYKSFLRMAAIYGTRGGGVHHFQLKDGYRYILTDGAELKSNSGLSDNVSWDICRLNHYVIKSNSEFFHKKMARGRAAGNNNDLNNSFFKNHDKNDIKDSFNYKFISKVKHAKRLLDERFSVQTDKLRHPPLYRCSNPLEGKSYIDSLVKLNSLLSLEGWFYYSGGNVIESIYLLINKNEYISPVSFIKKNRPDVTACGISDYDMCGFVATFDLSLIVCGAVQQLDIYAVNPSGDVIHDLSYKNKTDTLKELFPKLSVSV